MNLSLPVAVTLSLLTACSTEIPRTTSYLLTPMPIRGSVDYRPAQPIIVLAPVAMDNLLEHKGIVYQATPTEAVVAHQHLWADSIATQLANRLVTGLRQGQTRYWITLNSPLLNTPEVATLLVRLHKFNGSYQGHAVVAGDWSLLGGQGTLLRSQPFNLQEPLVVDGYTALVDALSTATDRLIGELSQALSGLAIETPPK